MTAVVRAMRTRRAHGKLPQAVSDRRLAIALAAPATLLICVFALYPFVLSFVNAFNAVDVVTGAQSFVGLGNFRDVVTDPAIRAALMRTIAWSLGNIALQVVVGVAVALLLNAGLKGQNIARGLVLFPYMVPAIVVALVFRFMFNDVTGLVNYLLLQAHLISEPIGWLSDPGKVLPTLILVNVWKYSPFFIIIVLARLQTIPAELYEAVKMDGGGRRHSFAAVILPAIMPVLLVGMMLRTIWTAYDFDIPYLLSAGGGPGDSAVTVPLKIQSLAFDSQNIGGASALAVCTAILLMGASYFYLRSYQARDL